MTRYMLVLRDEIGKVDDISPDEMQKIIEAYGAWCGKLGDKHLGGEKLCDGEGRIVRSSGAQPEITDGPYVETKEIFGGYFLIQAESYDQALELVQDCPHLRFGSIEIRAVEELGGS